MMCCNLYLGKWVWFGSQSECVSEWRPWEGSVETWDPRTGRPFKMWSCVTCLLWSIHLIWFDLLCVSWWTLKVLVMGFGFGLMDTLVLKPRTKASVNIQQQGSRFGSLFRTRVSTNFLPCVLERTKTQPHVCSLGRHGLVSKFRLG